ncbi:MAG: type II secretion system minor pseudopilin GspI [Xanthomonadales bacterium]|nr:type II secretion system minor pseudopilin GspI [Xanthomonadales bacterium]
MMNRKRQSGFTLMEVIVSLAILTISLSAIVTVNSNRAETLLEIRERNHAVLVANNVLEQYYLENNVASGTYDGRQVSGNREWNWQIHIEPTNNEHILRMDVKVSKEADFKYSHAQLTGFKWY